MTIAEFQAWLDGYSASFGDAPNAEQWAKIKGKIATLAVVSVPGGTYGDLRGGGGSVDNIVRTATGRPLSIDGH